MKKYLIKYRGSLLLFGFVFVSLFLLAGANSCWDFLIPNNNPVATAESDKTSAAIGEEIRFDGSASMDSDGVIISFDWSFGDGESDSGEKVTHTYKETDTYTVRLTVTDEDGGIGQDTIEIHITTNGGMPPTADAGPDKVGWPGEPVVFSGSGSSDPDGSIVSWVWDFGDGNTGNGETVQHSYSNTGTFTVALTVTDNDGLKGTDTAIVTIMDAPQVSFDSATYIGLVDPAIVTLVNGAGNTNSKQVESLVVTLFSEKTETIGEVISLTETGSNTGVFVGDVLFERPYTNSGYVVIETNGRLGVSADGSATAREQITVEYLFGNSPLIATAQYEEPPSTVTGVVRDQNGAAIPKAAVRIYEANGPYDVTVASRANGVYAIYDVPSGTYTLVAAKDNYTYVTKSVMIP